jgi:XTP/dITP diphosphohydrolase
VSTLVLATHNAHKVGELRDILGDRLAGWNLVGYDGPEPVEDGDTFEVNALIKARAAFLHTGLPSLADDSGISVDALDGAPGIHSARFAGTRDDADNRALLLERMRGVSDRTAAFTCAAAYVDAAGEHVEVGLWRGSVLDAATGEGGFGYDPVFRPDGLDSSAAQLSADEKNAISHRTQAFGSLVNWISANR